MCDVDGFADRYEVLGDRGSVFRSKRGDRMKVLVCDGSDLLLIYKRLEAGSLTWPEVQDGEMRLSRVQFEVLRGPRLATRDLLATSRSGGGTMLASLVATCKMSDVNPITYLAAMLRSLIDGHRKSRIEGMPWTAPDAKGVAA